LLRTRCLNSEWQASSVVCSVALGAGVSIVQPVDIVDEFVGFGTETDWLDVQVLKTLAAWLSDQVLRLNGHELWVEPRAEHLAVERLGPVHVLVVIHVLHGHSCHVWLDLGDVEEHLVDFLVVVSVGTT